MIRLGHIVEQLTELGNILNPFSWDDDFEDDDGNIFYSFKTPKHTYSVAFTPHGVDRYELFFNTEGDMGQDTEEGVAMRVLSTIVEIVNDFIEKRNPLEIIFRPIKTKGADDKRRFNVYGVYLEKNKPSNYDLVIVGDTYRWIQK